MKKGLQKWPALVILSIGSVIRAQRLRVSLSLGRFAREIDVSEDEAGAIERGEYELDVLLLFRIASVLKIPTSRILKRAEGRGRRLHLKGEKTKRSPNKKRAGSRKPPR